MKFFLKSFIFFFILSGVSHSNENIRFVDINFIVNNSKVGKSLGIIIDDKNKKINSELKNLKQKLDLKKEKILSQKNVLKKEEIKDLVKNYEKEAKDFNQIRKKKMSDFKRSRIHFEHPHHAPPIFQYLDARLLYISVASRWFSSLSS